MPITRCATPADTEAALTALIAAKSSAFFVFFGSEDPATGASWCPDCVTADPILRRTITAKRPDLTLYECPVGLRSDWKNRPEHPYRVHPVFHVARIPTLVRIDAGMDVGRLVETDCAVTEWVERFVS